MISQAVAEFIDSTHVALSPVERFRRTVAEPDDWQREFLESRDPILSILASRQVGKSSVVASAAYDEITRGGFVLILAPSERQSRNTLQKIVFARSRDRHSPPLIRSTQTELELMGGGRVVCIPQSSDTARGMSAVTLIVLEEAAFTDDEAIHAVIPSLAEDGRIMAISTPGGKRGGFFFDLLKNPEVRSIIARATDIPRMAKKVAFLRKVLPDIRFRVEVELEWLTNGQQFIASDVIEKAFNNQEGAMQL